MRAAPTRLKMFASQAPHFAPGAAPKPARRARGTRFPRRRRKTVLKRPLWGCVYTDNGKRVSEIMIRAIFKQSEQSFSWKFVSRESHRSPPVGEPERETWGFESEAGPRPRRAGTWVQPASASQSGHLGAGRNRTFPPRAAMKVK